MKKEHHISDSDKNNSHCHCNCSDHNHTDEDLLHSQNFCGCGHHHHDHEAKGWKKFIPEIISGVLMVIALLIPWSSTFVEIIAYIVSVLPVGIPIMRSTFKEWYKGDFFNEFTLMVLASIGAFCIGEYPEGVAVLLFYSIGEKLEDVVSGDVKSQIKRLLGKMPKQATVIENDERILIEPEKVRPDMVIAVKPGESVPLDGILLSADGADFNTAAITGESLPRFIKKGMPVNSGVIPVDKEVHISVTHEFSDSSMSRIIHMIEDASLHRAPSETILRKITRWYTPIVFGAAILLFIIPWIVSLCNPDFIFEWAVWLRRSLVFLVCSCPCALIVSIPLTYFASIGIASKKGILFKGHDSLDSMRKVSTALFDKTGTITTGKFHVEKILTFNDIDENVVLSTVASIEQTSKHPLAQAILNECKIRNLSLKDHMDAKTENHGISARIDGKDFLIGSSRIMKSKGIELPDNTVEGTHVYLSIDNKIAGCIILVDTVKEEALEAVKELHLNGVKKIGILSGDATTAVVAAVKSVNADFGEGELMPADKQEIIRKEQREGSVVAFAGDGINDAPALAAANVGIAMGNVGTDLAIESAQVVIAGDDLRKISEGVNISRKVKNVIIENVTFAFGVKLAVMILGAFGIASLWAAVFADTGVTLLTVAWTLYRLKIWELKKNQSI